MINQKYVITAAHCVNSEKLTNRQWRPTTVRLGEYDLRYDLDCDGLTDCAEPVEDIDIAEIVPHEAYSLHSPQQEHDIALIRLARPVQFSDFIRPICLPLGDQFKNKEYKDGLAEVVGWGKAENGKKANSKSVGLQFHHRLPLQLLTATSKK